MDPVIRSDWLLTLLGWQLKLHARGLADISMNWICINYQQINFSQHI